ncbi:MAG: low affinity iron permease family protein [Micavibrio aeruginosavorus]|uniref:Low affinity iron permease family protein n=1 Tax=Micavibrio aeruginosavorus TaxID=349221 RepID=A0A2W5MTV6_9BACT|nr:MAG: low affinity iron permease family protein [Micavibrio aeruginosavorus]
MKSDNLFVALSHKVAMATGHPFTFFIALGIILAWGITGPIFGFNDTWQLVINTGTTIITFLMVFLIQSTQNRDTAAMQLKLDELIRVTEGAHTVLLDLEELDDNQLEKFRTEYEKIARIARTNIENGGTDTHVPDVDVSLLCGKTR